MWAERNREDARLLADGDLRRFSRRTTRSSSAAAARACAPRTTRYEVAHRVIERLARELRSGRTYPVPYSVVVHKVINWKVVEFFSDPQPSALPEHWDAGELDRALEDFEGTYDLVELFARVPGRTGDVLELTYLEGLEPDEVAERLEMERNAVYQALHRGHRKIRDFLLDDDG